MNDYDYYDFTSSYNDWSRAWLDSLPEASIKVSLHTADPTVDPASLEEWEDINVI